MNDLPHRRCNLLTGEWVLVSPQRVFRPWQGEDSPSQDSALGYDPDCYLCPGNVRASGERNPRYAGTYVFPNDYPALIDRSVAAPTSGIFASEPATGEAHVICYSPDHAATLATLDAGRLRGVVDSWAELSAGLGVRSAHVQIFENKGAMMGCSSPHPHGQVWASSFIPSAVQREDAMQRQWLHDTGAPLLASLADAELAAGERIVEDNGHWLAVVPYWAAWPFETLLIPRERLARLEDASQNARVALAAILKRLLARYDALFGVSFPYSMGWHGAPHSLRGDTAHWTLHAHFYPPLLRSASVRKFMVGFELLAESQRDVTPEAAAEKLREVGI